MSYFAGIDTVSFEGEDSTNPLAFRHYDPDEIVMGKPMRDHLRFAVCYWHNFVWDGNDPFGGQTFDRPWFPANTMEQAKQKADAAFEMFRILNVPFWCFHDHDIRPEGTSLRESHDRLNEMADYVQAKMENGSPQLLWGTAKMFSNRRYMSGASTNPDPDVFAYCASTVKSCMDVTHRLGGQNYVLWGGREGYETLLNTDLKRERNNLAPFGLQFLQGTHKVRFVWLVCGLSNKGYIFQFISNVYRTFFDLLTKVSWQIHGTDFRRAIKLCEIPNTDLDLLIIRCSTCIMQRVERFGHLARSRKW